MIQKKWTELEIGDIFSVNPDSEQFVKREYHVDLYGLHWNARAADDSSIYIDIPDSQSVFVPEPPSLSDKKEVKE